MNDRALRASPTDGHQNGIEGELPPQRRLCRPADDRDAHKPQHTMLAARLPSLAEIEEYSRCTVNDVTRDEGRPDQPLVGRRKA